MPGDAAYVKHELAALLNPLPIAQALDVVRAFSYFSHLANLAEDVHQKNRRRAHAFAGSPPQSGSIRNRFPYLDPLNQLQVELVRRYRSGQTDERTKCSIH